MYSKPAFSVGSDETRPSIQQRLSMSQKKLRIESPTLVNGAGENAVTIASSARSVPLLSTESILIVWFVSQFRYRVNRWR